MHPTYLEARVRIDFLNPMFAALGWDVANAAALSEHERDVVTEGRLRTSSGTKFPDYLFQMGGKALFPVEAKKPSVYLKVDPQPALQLRRYAWNSGNLGVGILTDFQEFCVYDCRVPPRGDDKASVGLIDYYTVDDYAEKWDEISARFSREAVESGSLQEYVSTFKSTRGKQRVDRHFLAELEHWRQQLAIELARANTLTELELNAAVQLIIDRLVFLRIAEDRGLETYKDLQLAARGKNVFEALQENFRAADEKYNSGLFHLRREKGRPNHDTLTPTLKIADKILAEFINSLYWPAAPYDFQIFPSDVLGQVYEQFLGKVIKLDSPRVAHLEDKPEVRKAKGVYYTPTHVVAEIVRECIEPMLEKATPESLAKSSFAVCDPACGSGSFLIEVYQQLLDWHLKQYLKNEKKWTRASDRRIHVNAAGVWRLATSERKRILCDYVYGVDIDPQAVEVTKLALLLKVLEGETEATLFEQTALFHERVLPDLERNVKCGNSLVGNAIHFSAQQTLDADFERRVNAFDWDLEFPAIAKERGFDVIVGNPPWLMAGYYVDDTLAYMRESFATATGKFDLYYLFLEQTLRLLADGGRFGMIVPNKMFHTNAASALRELLASKADLELIRDFGVEAVFEGATNYSCVIIGRNQAPNAKTQFERVTKYLEVVDSFKVKQSDLKSGTWNFMSPEATALFSRMSAEHPLLSSMVERFGTGVQTGSDKLLTFEPSSPTSDFERKMLVPLLRGRDVKGFAINSSPKEMLFPYKSSGQSFVLMTPAELARYPKAHKYLTKNRAALSKRVWFDKSATELSGAWYGLMYVEQRKYLRKPHLLTPALSSGGDFAVGTGALFATGTAGVTSIVLSDGLPESIEFLLGILNSSLATAWVYAHSPVFQGGYRKFTKPYLSEIPIARPNLSTSKGKSQHDEIVALVRDATRTTSQLKTEGAVAATSRLTRRLQAALRDLDTKVAELYELSKVEQTAARAIFER